MKIKTPLILFACLLQSKAWSYDVITCGDAMIVGKEARLSLHQTAQKRAIEDAEKFMGKNITKPYIEAFEPACFPSKTSCKVSGTLETTASMIEVFWCESANTPLHSAYYSLYTSSQVYYDPRFFISQEKN